MCGRSGRFHVEAKSAAQPSGHEKADEAGDTEKEEDNDCAIDQAKLCLFRVIGRDERRIENIALPAHAECNPSHVIPSSIRRATGDRQGVNQKVTRMGTTGQDFVPGFDTEIARVRRCQAGCPKNRRSRLSMIAAKRS